MNVIGHYTVNESTVFGCFLGASKAFDRVNHTLLFNELLNKNLPPVIVYFLLFWYSEQGLGVDGTLLSLKSSWCTAGWCSLTYSVYY